MNGDSKGELVSAMNVLVRRRANTVDPDEKAVINDALQKLNGWIQDLDQASLLAAAQIVADASDALETVVASARLGPFDHYLSDIQAVLEALQQRLGQMHASESLPDAAAAPKSGALPAAALPSLAPVPAFVPLPDKTFAKLADEYADFFARCTLRPEFAGNVGFYVSRLRKFKPVYEATGAELGIPWTFIGIVHGMECGFDFTTHLHNGDSLQKRTVQVPRNRPKTGTPPFTWRESARDALMLEGLHHETQWSVPRMLFLWERYNGFGYRARGVPSPYLWSFSNIYSAGKFTSDGGFDPAAVSKQCGTAVMLKALMKEGLA